MFSNARVIFKGLETRGIFAAKIIGIFNKCNVWQTFFKPLHDFMYHFYGEQFA